MAATKYRWKETSPGTWEQPWNPQTGEVIYNPQTRQYDIYSHTRAGVVVGQYTQKQFSEKVGRDMGMDAARGGAAARSRLHQAERERVAALPTTIKKEFTIDLREKWAREKAKTEQAKAQTEPYWTEHGGRTVPREYWATTSKEYGQVGPTGLVEHTPKEVSVIYDPPKYGLPPYRPEVVAEKIKKGEIILEATKEKPKRALEQLGYDTTQKQFSFLERTPVIRDLWGPTAKQIYPSTIAAVKTFGMPFEFIKGVTKQATTWMREEDYFSLKVLGGTIKYKKQKLPVDPFVISLLEEGPGKPYKMAGLFILGGAVTSVIARASIFLRTVSPAVKTFISPTTSFISKVTPSFILGTAKYSLKMAKGTVKVAIPSLYFGTRAKEYREAEPGLERQRVLAQTIVETSLLYAGMKSVTKGEAKLKTDIKEKIKGYPEGVVVSETKGVMRGEPYKATGFKLYKEGVAYENIKFKGYNILVRSDTKKTTVRVLSGDKLVRTKTYPTPEPIKLDLLGKGKTTYSIDLLKPSPTERFYYEETGPTAPKLTKAPSPKTYLQHFETTTADYKGVRFTEKGGVKALETAKIETQTYGKFRTVAAGRRDELYILERLPEGGVKVSLERTHYEPKFVFGEKVTQEEKYLFFEVTKKGFKAGRFEPPDWVTVGKEKTYFTGEYTYVNPDVPRAEYEKLIEQPKIGLKETKLKQSYEISSIGYKGVKAVGEATAQKPVLVLFTEEKQEQISKTTPVTKEIQITEPVTKEVQISTSIPISREIQISTSIPISREISVSKNIQISKSIPISREISVSKNIQISKSIPISKEVSISKEIQISKSIQISKEIPISKDIVTTRLITTPPPTTPVMPPPIIALPKPQLEPEKKKGLYDVLVRRRGKFEKIATFPTLKQAFLSGRKRVFGTAAASFKVEAVDTTEDISGGKKFLSPKKFRESKKEPGVFIQRRRFRISSPGEKKEITFKGLFVQRMKRKSKGLFGGF